MTRSPEAVAQAYDHAAPVYDASFKTRADRAENQHVRRLLKDWVVRPTDHVLDLACGTGLFLDLLTHEATRYLGVDLSQGMLNHARAKHPRHAFQKADMDAFLFEALESGAKWDAITLLFAGLNYVPEPSRTLRLARQVMVPGAAILSITYAPTYAQRHQAIAEGTVADAPVDYFDARRLRGIYRAAGFRDVRIEALHTRLPANWPVAAHRLSLALQAACPPRADAPFLIAQAVA